MSALYTAIKQVVRREMEDEAADREQQEERRLRKLLGMNE